MALTSDEVRRLDSPMLWSAYSGEHICEGITTKRRATFKAISVTDR